MKEQQQFEEVVPRRNLRLDSRLIPKPGLSQGFSSIIAIFRLALAMQSGLCNRF